VIVVDASAILDWLLLTPASATIEARLLASGKTLHAPHLLDLEVAQVLRRHERTGQITAERGRLALLDLEDLQIERYPHWLLLSRIWDLRDTMTAYDAAYVALAELLGAPLVTRDLRLSRAGGHGARIELV